MIKIVPRTILPTKSLKFENQILTLRIIMEQFENRNEDKSTPLVPQLQIEIRPGLSLTSGTPPDVSGATSVVDFVTSDHAFQISNQIINAVSVP